MDFLLRPFRTEDAESLRLNADNLNIARYMRDGFPCPFTEADAIRLIASLKDAPADRVLARAIDVNGCAVGSIGIFVQADVYAKTADIAYWVGQTYWGKGIMTDAAQKMCRMAFERFAIVRIQAEPFAENLASHRVLEKSGFIKEGRLRFRVYKGGYIQDAFIYSLIRPMQ